MQYDMERFDQPLVDEAQPKAHVWTDIGEAEVEHSIFGKARVRVHRKQDEIRGAVRWTLLTVVIVFGAVWLVNGVSRQPAIVLVAPTEPVVALPTPEVQQSVPVQKPRVIPPVAVRKPVPQLQAASAPVAARPLTSAPVAVSGASAPAVARPAPVAPRPVAMGAPLAVKPIAPAAQATSAGPADLQAPAVASSAVTSTD